MKLLFLLIAFTTFTAHAQRVPDSLSHGLYVSSEGFELNPAKTEWIRTSSPSDLKNKIEALFRIKDEKALNQPTFTIRIDKDTPYKTLREYSKKWLRNYSEFGLEVLGHKYFKNKKDQSGFVIDIANSTSHKKLRQVIFFKDSKAVILTCMDGKDSFKTSLKSCNDLIKTFAWDNLRDAIPSNPEVLSN